eukprot:INCI8316.3.p1 GENE.INCI8316.3~~INCI8316.3.p1  ORF type:complete len:1645 (+),score=286.82 INCI8316.3:413-5347(+)
MSSSSRFLKMAADLRAGVLNHHHPSQDFSAAARLSTATALPSSPPHRASDKFLAMAKSIGSSLNVHHSPGARTFRQEHENEQDKQPTKAASDARGRNLYATHFAFTPSQVHQKKSEARFVADFMNNKMINEETALATGAIDAVAGVPGVNCSDLWELNDSPSPFKRGARFPENEVPHKISKANSSPTRRYLSVTEMAQTLVQRESVDDSRSGAQVSPKLHKSKVPPQTTDLAHLSIDFLRKHATTHPALAAQLLAREKQLEETRRDNARRAAAVKHRKARAGFAREGAGGDHQIARPTPTAVANPQNSMNAPGVSKNDLGSDTKPVENYHTSKAALTKSAKGSSMEEISTSVANAKEQQGSMRVLVLIDSCQSIEVEIDPCKTARHFYSCLYRKNARFFLHDHNESSATDSFPMRQCPPPKSVLYSGLGNIEGTAGLIHRDKAKLEDHLLSDTSVLQFVHYFASVHDAIEDLEVKAARRKDPRKALSQRGTASEKWFATGMLFGARSFGSTPATVMRSSISLVGTLLSAQHQHLCTLVLDNQGLEDQHVAPLFSVLHKTPIRCLSLRHNNVTRAGAHIIARCILRISEAVGQVKPTEMHDNDNNARIWRVLRVDLVGNNQLGVESAKILGAAILLRKQHALSQGQHESSTSSADAPACPVMAHFFRQRKRGSICPPIQVLLGRTEGYPGNFRVVQHVWQHIVPIFGLPQQLLKPSVSASTSSHGCVSAVDVDDKHHTDLDNFDSGDLCGNNFATDSAILQYLFEAGEASRRRLKCLNRDIHSMLNHLQQAGNSFVSMQEKSAKLNELIGEAKTIAEQLQVTDRAVENASVYKLEEIMHGTVNDVRSNDHGKQPTTRQARPPQSIHTAQPPFLHQHHAGNDSVFFDGPASANNMRNSEAAERSLALLDIAQGRERFGAAEQRRLVASRNFVRRHSDPDTSQALGYLSPGKDSTNSDFAPELTSIQNHDSFMSEPCSRATKFDDDVERSLFDEKSQLLSRGTPQHRREDPSDFRSGGAHIAAEAHFAQHSQQKTTFDVASTLLQLGEKRLAGGGSYQDAMSVFRRAIAVARSEWREEGSHAVGQRSRHRLETLANSMTRLGDLLLTREHCALEAARLYNEVLPYTFQLRGPNHTDVARIFDRIAAALGLHIEQAAQGQPGLTNVGYTEPGLVFSPVATLPPSCADILHKIEHACLRSLRLRENHHHHVEAQRAIHGNTSSNLVDTTGSPELLLAMEMLTPLNHLGLCYMRLGDHDRAERYLQRALALSQRHHGAVHQRQGTSFKVVPRDGFQASVVMHAFALLRVQQRRIPEGVAILRRALDIRRAACGKEHVATAQTMLSLGILLFAHMKQLTDAERLISASFNILLRCANGSNRNVLSSVSVPSSTIHSGTEVQLMSMFLENLENPPTVDKSSHSSQYHPGSITVDNPLDNDPHALLLASSFTARSLRGLVYDSCVWRARVAGQLQKNVLAKELFEFAAEIAKAHWKPQRHDGVDSEFGDMSTYIADRDHTGTQGAGCVEGQEEVSKTFHPRGWQSGHKRSWERRDRYPRLRNESNVEKRDRQEAARIRRHLAEKKHGPANGWKQPSKMEGRSWYDSDTREAQKFFEVDHEVREAESMSRQFFEMWAPDDSRHTAGHTTPISKP